MLYLTKNIIPKIFFLIFVVLLVNCQEKQPKNQTERDTLTEVQRKIKQYVQVKLNGNIDSLPESEKKILKLLIETGKIVDKIYRKQTTFDVDSIFPQISDPDVKKLYEINYGPWDRMNNHKSFVAGIPDKPKGANFYPADITKSEFEAFENAQKTSRYTLIRRDKNRKLIILPYHEAFEKELIEASELLKNAAELSENKDFKIYLQLQAEALLTDNFYRCDTALLNVKNSNIECLFGANEGYEDGLFGYKYPYNALILLKNNSWGKRLSKYVKMLRFLQKALPVPEEYRSEEPGINFDINVYDALFYGGSYNSGGKIISTTLPIDAKIQVEKGSKNFHMENVSTAKFENILLPIADLIIAPKQREFVTAEAFLQNQIFHEMAQSLGIRNVLGNKGTVRENLKEFHNVLEQVKANVLKLFFIQKLHTVKELDNNINENYVTFLANVFRSVRFGAANPHAVSNLICFNFFKENKVFEKTKKGLYKIDEKKMEEAVNLLANKIILIQGNGDYAAASNFVKKYSQIDSEMQETLENIKKVHIPVDLIFQQGTEVLGI